MKIFEKIQLVDGGPNDKGTVIGYERGESEQQLKHKFGINHGFISFREISIKEYTKRKNQLLKQLKLFKF